MYYYYSSPDDPNRISFAGEYNEGVLRIAAARTSTKDHFVRRTGRMKATGKLKGNILLHERALDKDQFSIKLFVETCKSLIPYIHRDPAVINVKFV